VARITDQTRELYGDKVQVSVYLTPELSKEDPDCREATCQAISNALDANPEVQSKEFESQAQALERYKQQFAGQPEMLDIVTPDALSASFRVKLVDPQRYRVIAEEFTDKDGVQSVADQSAFLDRLFSLLNGIRNATIIVALVQALAALLLISNMVQIAAYTRRTETSIMRLVGASRWRTQLPFMLEAVIAGVVGAALAIGGLVAAKFLFVDQALGPVIRSGILPEIDTATLVWVSPILLAIGAGLAAVSAYVTLRLYVRL
jgi:cell division transport system permease protein